MFFSSTLSLCAKRDSFEIKNKRNVCLRVFLAKNGAKAKSLG